MKRDQNNIGLKTQLNGVQSFILEGGINTEKRAQYLKRPNRDFTRQRKLNFETTVTFILGLLKKV